MKAFLLRLIAPIALPAALRLHQYLYKVISRLAVLSHNGVHPKHDILRYEDWFLDRIPTGAHVLEVGSHDGEMSRKIVTKAAQVIAIEIEKKLYDAAIRKNVHPKIDFIHGDATRFKPPGKIDVIVLSNVLEHIQSRIEFLKSLRANIQAPATLLVRVPLITRDWVPIYKRQLGLEYRLDPTHFTEYTEAELRSELEAAGYAIQTMDVRFGEAYVVCR